MRDGADGDAPRRTGVYLGAYAWLEDLRPSTVAPTPGAARRPTSRRSSPAPSPDRQRPGATAATSTRPSLPHARTAAVLRSGYLANATAGQPADAGRQPLVRPRAPRAVAARGHPQRAEPRRAARLPLRARPARRHGLAEVDKFIFPLRKAFPLVGRLARADEDGPDVPIEAIEARNVLDGRKLVDARSEPSGARGLPVRAAPTLPRRDAAEADGDQRRRRPRCSTSTTRSPTSRWRRACTRRCRATSTASRRTLDAYTTGNFPPEPRGRADAADRDRAHPPRRPAPRARTGARRRARRRARRPSRRSTPGSPACCPA